MRLSILLFTVFTSVKSFAASSSSFQEMYSNFCEQGYEESWIGDWRTLMSKGSIPESPYLTQDAQKRNVQALFKVLEIDFCAQRILPSLTPKDIHDFVTGLSLYIKDPYRRDFRLRSLSLLLGHLHSKAHPLRIEERLKDVLVTSPFGTSPFGDQSSLSAALSHPDFPNLVDVSSFSRFFDRKTVSINEKKVVLGALLDAEEKSVSRKKYFQERGRMSPFFAYYFSSDDISLFDVAYSLLLRKISRIGHGTQESIWQHVAMDMAFRQIATLDEKLKDRFFQILSLDTEHMNSVNRLYDEGDVKGNLSLPQFTAMEQHYTLHNRITQDRRAPSNLFALIKNTAGNEKSKFLMMFYFVQKLIICDLPDEEIVVFSNALKALIQIDPKQAKAFLYSFLPFIDEDQDKSYPFYFLNKSIWAGITVLMKPDAQEKKIIRFLITHDPSIVKKVYINALRMIQKTRTADQLSSESLEQYRKILEKLAESDLGADANIFIEYLQFLSGPDLKKVCCDLLRERLPINIKKIVLNTLLKLDPAEGERIFREILPKLTSSDQQNLASLFSKEVEEEALGSVEANLYKMIEERFKRLPPNYQNDYDIRRLLADFYIRNQRCAKKAIDLIMRPDFFTYGQHGQLYYLNGIAERILGSNERPFIGVLQTAFRSLLSKYSGFDMLRHICNSENILDQLQLWKEYVDLLYKVTNPPYFEKPGDVPYISLMLDRCQHLTTIGHDISYKLLHRAEIYNDQERYKEVLKGFIVYTSSLKDKYTRMDNYFKELDNREKYTDEMRQNALLVFEYIMKTENKAEQKRKKPYFEEWKRLYEGSSSKKTRTSISAEMMMPLSGGGLGGSQQGG